MKYVQVTHTLLCFYRSGIGLTLCGIITLILNVIYYMTVFKYGIDSDNELTYRNDLFATTCLVTTYSIVLQGLYVGLCIAFFYMHHQAKFENILARERALTFHGAFKEVMEILDGLEHQSLQLFVKYWKHKSDEHILETLSEKQNSIFKVFKDSIDIDKNEVISYDEFILFAHKHNIMDIELLWNIMTHHRVTKCIDADVIEYMLYHTLFQKQQFALAIDTDMLLTKWITMYITAFSLPLLGIVLSSIWGYAAAFNGNLSLFQIYILAASFAMNRLASNIRFASYMATVRPFNLGELLMIQGDVYKIIKLCPTYVVCIGRDTMVLRNSQMLDNMICNYSRSNIYDVFTLELPLNTADTLVSMVHEKMLSYARQNWKEIDEGSIRCGWVTMRNQSKVLQCNWRYNFMIYDRTRFNNIRTRFVNDVIRVTIDDATRSIILLNAAQGSVLNPSVVKHYMAVDSQHQTSF
jgi:hypothetical protein